MIFGITYFCDLIRETSLSMKIILNVLSVIISGVSYISTMKM